MSTTPRTDDEFAGWGERCPRFMPRLGEPSGDDYVRREFARQLETELNALQDELKHTVPLQYHDEIVQEAINEKVKETTVLRAENEQLKQQHERMKTLLEAIETDAQKDKSTFAYNILQPIHALLLDFHHDAMLKEAAEIQENNYINSAILEHTRPRSICMNTSTTFKPIATMITCREDDEYAMVTLREYCELQRENARLKDTLKTGEMPDPVWSKDDLCFMYRNVLEERDNAHTENLKLSEENAALRADKERLDWIARSPDKRLNVVHDIWVNDGDIADVRAAVDAAMKEASK